MLRFAFSNGLLTLTQPAVLGGQAKASQFTADSLRMDALLVIPLVSGALLGPVILRHINQRAFEVMALVLTVAAAVRLVW